MKTKIYLPAILLPIGIIALLLQGCYTQVATIREDESSYEQEGQYSSQNDSTYQGDDDNWQPHNYIGFSYYYPSWRSYWGWDYGCVYPSYWDPWYWGPAFYVDYYYYPHYWGYWDSYRGYHHGGYGGHYDHSRPFATRDFGNQRGGNGTRAFGTTRSTRNGDATTRATGSTQAGSNRGNIRLPQSAGRSAQPGGTSSSRGLSNTRSSRGQYMPSVQQPRHRDRSSVGTNAGRTARAGRQGGFTLGKRSGSRSDNPVPSVAPRSAPAPRNSAPQSAPAPRNSGGEQRSGDSGRRGR